MTEYENEICYGDDTDMLDTLFDIMLDNLKHIPTNRRLKITLFIEPDDLNISCAVSELPDVANI